MACGPGAPAGEGAEPQRRRRWGWARARALGGNSEASTTGLLAHRQQGQEAESESSSSAGRRRSCKVAPEPREGAAADAAALPPTPGSPSFRYYCEKTAFVDRIVTDTDDSDGSIGHKATTGQASNGDEVTKTNVHESHECSQVHEHKEGAKWPRFRGLSMVASAWNNVFSRHHSSSKPSPCPAAAGEPQPPPAAAAATVRSPL